MQFEKGAKLYSYSVQKEGGEDVMYINYIGAPFVPSISDHPEVMEMTIDALIESPSVSRIVFVQQKNYNHDFRETAMLLELAQLYVYLIKQEAVLSQARLITSEQQFFPRRYNEMFYFLYFLKRDPVSAYRELKRVMIEAKIFLDKLQSSQRTDQENYIRLLEKLFKLILKTELVRRASPYLKYYKKGDREIYNRIFKPDVIPNFTFTRLISDIPDDVEVMAQYKIAYGSYDESTVTVLRKKDEAKFIYHLEPPENSLSEEHNTLLNLARGVLIEHEPKAEEFIDTERTRQVFFNISKDLLQDLAQSKGIKLSYQDLNKLSAILVRHTIGFGVIEVLLQDAKLQDIVLNAPISMTNIFVRHQDFDECVTNILPSQGDADSWAAKFRMISGRPLDEANPILDTQLEIGKMRARIAVIQQPLSPDGLSYAMRRHREEPWTLQLFAQNKMINPLAAGLLSFLVDGARTLLVSGTRSSGKTSVLGSLMLEIIPKFRVIVIEDSVTGDAKIVIKEKGEFKKTTIGELIDTQITKHGFIDIDGREKSFNLDDIEIFSVNKDGKVILTKPSKFIKHKVTKPIYEITTTSGKKIKVTEDHSLFTIDEKNILKPVRCGDLKEKDFIAIPLRLSFNNSMKNINLLDYANKFGKKLFVIGKNIERYLIENRKGLFSLAYSLGYKKSTIQSWIRNKIIPVKIFDKIEDGIKEDSLLIKSYGCSKKISSDLILDDNFLSFVGLWLADGCYDKNSVIISVQEEENREVVKKVAENFNTDIKMHNDKFSVMINSVLLKEIMQKILELNGDSHTKKIPSWMYNLSDKQIGSLLKGLFSGDGCVSNSEVLLSVCSKELIDDIATLLLRFGIITRNSSSSPKSPFSDEKREMFCCRVGCTKMINKFKENIGFLVKSKQEKLERLNLRVSTHDTTDIIPLSLKVKNELNEILGKRFNKHDYVTRENNIGREHLVKLFNFIPEGINNPIDPLKKITQSDIFWDRVKNIKKVSTGKFVYDISVPGHENFICENIVAHNSLELPVDSLRRLGYDILRMKVRSALLKTGTEVSADDGIRTSLRLGDSCLIIGEVRSVEAKALYEAMRVGALANVVAGTIHGASPYGVFDRVVNDLEVPVTSFKATDAIVVCNPVKTPDGLHSWRRVLQISEVRKHWREDPLEEKGFVDLMTYNVEKDELEPSEDLINGDSEIIKNIASNVKGWAGNWDAIYDNILLRAKIKKETIDMAVKTGKEKILEADFTALSNHMFHKISDEIREETGLPLGERVFPKWQKWLNKEIKKRKF